MARVNAISNDHLEKEAPRSKKAHLLKDKQILSVEVTWMAFGGKHVTWAYLEKKQTRLQLYTKSDDENAYSGWRQRHDSL
ncbi:hypothetical protein Tco_0736117 [Tanacetum coccineum]